MVVSTLAYLTTYVFYLSNLLIMLGYLVDHNAAPDERYTHDPCARAIDIVLLAQHLQQARVRSESSTIKPG